MREGVRRLAVAIRWLSWLWIAAWLIGAIASFDTLTQETSGRLLLAALVFGPGILGLGIAWILDGFAQPAKPKE